MSMPFYDRNITLTQPDGTKLQVRAWGDQHAAMMVTPAGQPVVQNAATGFYEFAKAEPGKGLVATGTVAGPGAAAAPPINVAAFSTAEFRTNVLSNPGLPVGGERWRTRRQRRLSTNINPSLAGLAFAPPTRPTVGKFVGLCLLIEFPDVPGTISRAEVDDFVNKTGYNGFGNAGSVRDYFLDVSSGKLDYHSVVVEYYKAKHKRSYYTDETIEQPIRAWELITEALNHLKKKKKNKKKFDFSQLTVDDEDYVYAINVYYAGDCVNGWAKGLWPHAYHLQQPMTLKTGVKAFDYQFTNMGGELTLGTFCHENGHMICDFPDLYDYGYESYGAGAYCLMCAGGNTSPKNPGHVGAYLKYKAGWATKMTTLAKGQKMTLAAGSNDMCIFARNPQEYYILETRHASGRDAALPDSGLAIWHVDERGSNDHEHGTPALHYECSLVQADGQRELERKINYGGPGDLYPTATVTSFGAGTVPASQWWSGSASGLELHAITRVAPNTVQFSVQ